MEEVNKKESYNVFINALARTYNEGKKSDFVYHRTGKEIKFIYNKKKYIIPLSRVSVLDFDNENKNNECNNKKKILEVKEGLKERSDLRGILKNKLERIGIDIEEDESVIDVIEKIKTWMVVNKENKILREVYDVCLLLCKEALKKEISKEKRIKVSIYLNMLRDMTFNSSIEGNIWDCSEEMIYKEQTGDFLIQNIFINEEEIKEKEKGKKEENEEKEEDVYSKEEDVYSKDEGLLNKGEEEKEYDGVDVGEEEIEYEDVEVDEEDLKVGCQKAIIRFKYEGVEEISEEMLRYIEKESKCEENILEEYTIYIKKLMNDEIKRKRKKEGVVGEKGLKRVKKTSTNEKKCTVRNPEPDERGICPETKPVKVLKDGKECCYVKAPNLKVAKGDVIEEEIKGVEESKEGNGEEEGEGEIKGVEESKETDGDDNERKGEMDGGGVGGMRNILNREGPKKTIKTRKTGNKGKDKKSVKWELPYSTETNNYRDILSSVDGK
jgi:hypothetical protein